MTELRGTSDELFGYDDAPLRCPECKEVAPGREWQEARVPCEDCGDHPAVRCPNCGDVVDTIYRDVSELIAD